MKLTILGSGTGTPSLHRNPCALLIRIENQNLVFDTGPGILKRLLEIGVTYHDIDYIFYSHFHTDHTLDLAAILFAAKYALSLRTKDLPIIGARGLKKFYQNLLNLYGQVIKPESYQIDLVEIAEQVTDFRSFTVKTLFMQHTPESLGYRIESKGKIIVYSGDTDVCVNLVKLGEQADILILDCSFPDEMKVPGHLIPQEAGEIAQRCNCKKLVLSHLYPVCQEQIIVQQAKKKFEGEVVVASDLMNIEL